MTLIQIGILAIGGLSSGVLAGFLGIGGGVLLVPLLVQLGFAPIQAAATSSLAILITATTGSFQNWRMGYLTPQRVVLLGIPALVTALIGTQVADKLPDYVLLAAFGGLLLSNLYLVGLKKRVVAQRQHSLSEREAQSESYSPARLTPLTARLVTGGVAGFMAGLFGVGGGVILVPLQILLLNESIKAAVRTSLGVIVITAISACVGHALNGNVVWLAGLLLGLGGLVGVQISTRFLPKLADQTVSLLFRTMLCLLTVYIFWQAWQAWQV
ncbi:MAG: sulfite exporter TauE/SafE family protein [Cyanobacteria bacterium P01_D01_bin.44]